MKNIDLSKFSDAELLDRVFQWAEENPKFNIGFVLSLDECLAKYHSLTKAQRQALEKLVLRWRIVG